MFVFDGEMYVHQPKWLTRFDHYFRKVSGWSGNWAVVNPVFGVLASSECDIDQLPWRNIAPSRVLVGGEGHETGRVLNRS
jgi:hypothetical protein